MLSSAPAACKNEHDFASGKLTDYPSRPHGLPSCVAHSDRLNVIVLT